MATCKSIINKTLKIPKRHCELSRVATNRQTINLSIYNLNIIYFYFCKSLSNICLTIYATVILYAVKWLNIKWVCNKTFFEIYFREISINNILLCEHFTWNKLLEGLVMLENGIFLILCFIENFPRISFIKQSLIVIS